MEYISAEEFLKQPIEVQREFKEYFDHEEMLFLDGVIYFGTFKDEVKYIPLLTEGQLRKFIEDKTNGKVEFYPDVYRGERYYTIMIRDNGCGGDDPEFEVDADDVLQAYWKVACEIAKEN